MENIKNLADKVKRSIWKLDNEDIEDLVISFIDLYRKNIEKSIEYYDTNKMMLKDEHKNTKKLNRAIIDKFVKEWIEYKS